MSSSRILIIEDDPTILRVLKDNFVAQGHSVQAATDGEAGLQAALTSAPDLILLDIMLPKVNGFELCRSVRCEGLKMPILMLTAKGQEEDIVRGLDLGADDYITKPFGIRELVARVNAFLRRHRAGVAPVYEFGPFRLDTISHRLLRDDSEVPLTGKEFGVLEFFLRNPGRALTRECIMQAVWGNSVMVTARSVDRCIATLRSKIEPEGEEVRFIQTLREIGYRFDG